MTDLDVLLLGTIVAEPQEFSAALIRENKSVKARGYGIGDDLVGEATIMEIRQKVVMIKRSDGSIERIEISEEGKEPKKKKSSDSKDKEEEGVSKTGTNQYTVDQEVFDQLIESPEKLYSQIRVVPHKDDSGEIDGYRLSGIRRKSVFYKLGVKNGDIVHTVNGKSLNSMSSAMDAYNSLSSSRNFSFEITRRRKKQTMEYEVR